MNSFFPSLVIELHNRCEKVVSILKALSLPSEIDPNLKITIKKVHGIKTDLESIFTDPDFGAPELLLNQINRYKRCYESYSLVEKIQLPILLRYSDKDAFFHAFLKNSLNHINYQIDTPLISAASTNYYEVFADKNPISSSFFVPVIDDLFLLNLPDLFHEIGHLIFLKNEKELSTEFIEKFDDYLSNERRRIKVQTRPFDPIFYDNLEELWKDSWSKEHVANMIATYCLGSSFGWQCLRICANTGEDVYFPAKIISQPDDHPSFESQMQGIVEILKMMRMTTEAIELNEKWNQYKTICHFDKPTEHDHCYPDYLMKSLAENVFQGCKTIGLKPFTAQKQDKKGINIPLLLDESWRLFHLDPKKYLLWEEETVKGLKASIYKKE
jgi:hypothetical protein